MFIDTTRCVSVSHVIKISLIGLLALSGCGEQSANHDQGTPAEESVAENTQPPTRSIFDEPEVESETADVGEDPAVDSVVEKVADDTVETINPDDGYPTGQSTPEGAASDLARAFMIPDGVLFKSVCYSWSGGESGEEYTKFIDDMVEKMDSMQGKNISDFGGPKEITAVHKARHLTKSGPGSYGFAVMNLHDVMFVDLVAETWEDTTFLSRTLVVQKSNKKWYVMPRPDLFPLLSAGLNQESESTTLWDEE